MKKQAYFLNSKGIFSCLSMLMLLCLLATSCTKIINEEEEEETIESGTPYGVWQRYDSPKGYNTDLAIGNIPGESSNRVYMCEHPGSPTAGLYKGYISGNIITWDAVHKLPDADFSVVGSERRLYFGVGAVEDAGKYKKGTWTNTCGELKKVPKNIYYTWTTGSTCPYPSDYSMTYVHPDLPGKLNQNQQYGPLAAGSVEINLSNSNGSFPTNYITLSEPPSGYKRIYKHTVYKFNSDVNRCLSYLNESGLTYVDQPL